MRTCLKILIAFILFSFARNGYGQTLKWGKELGSDKEEYSLNHVVDKAGNIYVSGKTTGDYEGKNLGLNDGFIVKLDPDGNLLWKKQFGSEGDEDILWSAIDNAGCVYITGSTTGSLAGKNAGREDIFVIRYEPSGEIAWKKQIGTDSSDVARGICPDKNGFIYLTGSTNGKLGNSISGKTDGFIMKLDSAGNILMSEQFGTPQDDQCLSITPGSKDDLFVCGTTWGQLSGDNSGFIDGFSGHFSQDLKLLGFNQFGSDGFDIPLVLHADKKNNIYIGGSTSGNFAEQQIGDGDCFLLKMDPAGKIIWKKQFGTDHHDGVRGIDADPKTPGNIFVSGIMNLPPEKAFIRIFSNDGDLIWEKTFEGTSGKDINLDGKGNFTSLGLTGNDFFGKLTGGHDFYLLKFSPR